MLIALSEYMCLQLVSHDSLSSLRHMKAAALGRRPSCLPCALLATTTVDTARLNTLTSPAWRRKTHQARHSITQFCGVLANKHAGSVTAATSLSTSSTEAQIMHSIEELLAIYGTDSITLLHGRIKSSIERRYRALNPQHSPLLKLPTETLLEIGRFILGPPGHDHSDDGNSSPKFGRVWFAQAVPFLCTRAQLWTQLYSLRHETMHLRHEYLHFDTLWDDLPRHIEIESRMGIHKGKAVAHVRLWKTPEDGSDYPATATSPSAAAAVAGALECKIYGRLSDPPMVHRGKMDTRARVFGDEIDDGEGAWRSLAIEEATAVWNKVSMS
ncbi:hypothetical protein Q7P37_010785 [Cladosporium fusiforme]